MPLVILTGYPCSGLTYRANQLAALIEKAQDEIFAAGDSASPVALKSRFKVNIVPSHDKSYPRTVYDHARTEKEARGMAYARTKRVLTRDSIVILDGMNYIKGWRYQLWCEAKAAGTTCCVVHIGTPVDQCIANNNARLQQAEKKGSNPDEAQEASSVEKAQTESESSSADEEPYSSELLNNLIFRYEEPSTHSRWDKPLFTVPWSDAEPPIEDIFHALTGIVLPSAQAPAEAPVLSLGDALATSTISDTASTTTTGRAFNRSTPLRPKIVPHQATVQAVATDSGALYDMEKRTTAIVTTLRNFTQSNPSAETALAQSTSHKGINIEVPHSSNPIFIPAHVATTGTTDELAGAGGILSLPRLQRLRRQWISLNRVHIGRGHAAGRGALGPEQIGDAFVRFLNNAIGGEEEAQL
ncbi:hypothetical protein N7462_002142 [Penicillium macrosclerotiorum]|uniref:uncharacterized protein n=1 Tax=Penicillium macrosclerotiorum TaxID=303699 RepID=UPI002546A671|nr:uncharacterized protein N7462_002142 [Penicillium macrosclerotiorum]KAJ5692719.1 hypothetical protein N7462_002142 [Penicillium macrosclerotiorum]